MQDYLSLGPAPSEETPVQLGTLDYARLAKIECAQFVEAIRQKLGREPEGARLSVQACPHDFGTYYDVVCYYDPSIPGAIDYAFRCESDAPASWEEAGMETPKKNLHER